MLLLATATLGNTADDHLTCYKIKDPLRLDATVDLSSPQFGLAAGCRVSRAKLFCAPSTKQVLEAGDKVGGPIVPLPLSAVPAPGDRVCYKVKCPAVDLPETDVTDQFGFRTVGRFKAKLLCTPAVRGAAYCGDGTIDAGEDCEPGDLGGATCTGLGFATGTLVCGAGCSFDTSECVPAAFPATGQMTCWDASGAVISCAGTGHDGDEQAGATLAYQDNGDGTITDLNTGLMWEKKSDDGGLHDKDVSFDWGSAFVVWLPSINTEGGSGFAGHDDWRLPNLKELLSIVDWGRR